MRNFRIKTPITLQINIIILISITSLILSCNPETTVKHEKKSNSYLPSSKVAANILLDISKSTTNTINVPDSSEALDIFSILSKDFENVIALGNIGFTTNSDRQFIRFNKMQIPLKDVNSGTMSQKKEAMTYNAKAQKYNDVKQQQFIKTFDSMTAREDQQTDINTALLRSVRLFGEPTFRNYKKILIIVSDGYQETRDSHKIDIDFSAASDTYIILVGWKTSIDGFNNINSEQITVFEGMQNVPVFISSIIKS